jgi:fatty acid desaturase
MHPATPTNADKAAIAEFIKNAKPDTRQALIKLLFWSWGLLILAIVPYILFPSIWTFALAFMAVTSRMGAALSLAHDAQHHTFLPNKKWNDLIGAWVCAYPMGSIYGSSRAVHLTHHRLLNKPDDPDRCFHIETDKDTPKKFAGHFVRLVFGGQLWSSIIVNGVLRPLGKDKPPEKPAVVVLTRKGHPEILNLIPVQLFIWGCLWLASGQWWLYIALWLGPIFTLGTFLGFLRGFVDHARLPSEEADPDDPGHDRLISIRKVNWIERCFLAGFSFHYHAEHHMFPSVPPYYLPELHKLLQSSDYYRSTYVVRESYTQFVIEYWKEIRDRAKMRLQITSPQAIESKAN